MKDNIIIDEGIFLDSLSTLKGEFVWYLTQDLGLIKGFRYRTKKNHSSLLYIETIKINKKGNLYIIDSMKLLNTPLWKKINTFYIANLFVEILKNDIKEKYSDIYNALKSFILSKDIEIKAITIYFLLKIIKLSGWWIPLEPICKKCNKKIKKYFEFSYNYNGLICSNCTSTNNLYPINIIYPISFLNKIKLNKIKEIHIPDLTFKFALKFLIEYYEYFREIQLKTTLLLKSEL